MCVLRTHAPFIHIRCHIVIHNSRWYLIQIQVCDTRHVKNSVRMNI